MNILRKCTDSTKSMEARRRIMCQIILIYHDGSIYSRDNYEAFEMNLNSGFHFAEGLVNPLD